MRSGCRHVDTPFSCARQPIMSSAPCARVAAETPARRGFHTALPPYGVVRCDPLGLPPYGPEERSSPSGAITFKSRIDMLVFAGQALSTSPPTLDLFQNLFVAHNRLGTPVRCSHSMRRAATGYRREDGVRQRSDPRLVERTDRDPYRPLRR